MLFHNLFCGIQQSRLKQGLEKVRIKQEQSKIAKFD